MRDPEGWLGGLPERTVRFWEVFAAETPFGPQALNHMLARLCATVNWAGPRPLDKGEAFWLPGVRHLQED